MSSDEKSIADAIKFFFGFRPMPNDGADLTKVEKLAAAIDSSNYLNSNMQGCKRYSTAAELLSAAMELRTIRNGLVMEFGVYSGQTINHIASLHAGMVFGFDSFEGLPEDWRPDFPKQTFKQANFPEVAPNVKLVTGWFEDSLPPFVATHQEPVSFIHVDCDLYSSTKTIFHYLGKYICPGTILVFDEYFNYVGWRNHEYKAFSEFIVASRLSYRYIGAVPSYHQVAVVIL